MLGGELSTLPAETFELITNPGWLALIQNGERPREVLRTGPWNCWESNLRNERYIAVFNVSDDQVKTGPELAGLGVSEGLNLAAHDAILIRI
jgi:hypothetical protein